MAPPLSAHMEARILEIAQTEVRRFVRLLEREAAYAEMGEAGFGNRRSLQTIIMRSAVAFDQGDGEHGPPDAA